MIDPAPSPVWWEDMGFHERVPTEVGDRFCPAHLVVLWEWETRAGWRRSAWCDECGLVVLDEITASPRTRRLESAVAGP